MIENQERQRFNPTEKNRELLEKGLKRLNESGVREIFEMVCEEIPGTRVEVDEGTLDNEVLIPPHIGIVAEDTHVTFGSQVTKKVEVGVWADDSGDSQVRIKVAATKTLMEKSAIDKEWSSDLTSRLPLQLREVGRETHSPKDVKESLKEVLSNAEYLLSHPVLIDQIKPDF